MHTSQIKNRAITLRRNGKSFSEISHILSISKSTASVWCRHIKLHPTAQSKLHKRTHAESLRQLRLSVQKRSLEKLKRIERARDCGARDVGELSKRDRYIAGLALYWGEGYKEGSGEVGFTNSDIHAIRFFIRWIKEFYGIPKSRISARLTVNVSHARFSQKIQSRWRRDTGLSPKSFTQTSIIKTKTKKRYTSEKTYRGTLRVKVRQGTDIHRRILGSLDRLKQRY